MKNLKIKKKITLAVATFFTMVTLLVIQSCDPDKILIDTSLKLPPVPLDTTGWVVTDYTSQEDQDGEGAGNGRVFNTFDGNPDTFWHTCWAGCTAVPPHYFVIDMLESKEINGIILTQRQSLSRNIEVCSIDISTDNSSWTSLGEFTLEKVKTGQDIALDQTVSGRYIRFNVVKVFDGTNNAALAEMAPYF
ncbi:discoidin domain-containing protein [Flavivirga spongiicola]|uniref:Discoidin domain-containing protein n=1 Tax=Flavivirga spongiicola TaxID=421621 RepID=A0ABU7XN56_9FLAO|nr:discoidin domain-containing protein [Flavivirga sp. MEBiC05379]MDO5981820.1 discoidin domain-containing protein [Flavivirga sp. MEBiC05379]